jgi:hypothetical protein
MRRMPVLAQSNSFNDPLAFDPTTATAQFLQMANSSSKGFFDYVTDPDNPYYATPISRAGFDGTPLEVAVASTMLLIQAGTYQSREALTGQELQLPGGGSTLYEIYTVGPPDNPIPGSRIANVPGSNTFYFSPYHYNPGPGVPNAYVQLTLYPH